MSLAFLAKKPWHLTTVKNVEKVWLAEKKQDEEEKRLSELQKQINEEREIDELRKLQRDAGLVTDPKQKLEWMYEGPGAAISSAARAEEYKLGKAYVPNTAKTELLQLEDKSAAGSTWLSSSSTKSNIANEEFVRINEDPLYRMRQSEKRVRDTTVLKNPLAMKRIKQSLSDELREYDQERKARKLAKKAKKKHTKKKKKKKHERRSKSESSSEEDFVSQGTVPTHYGLTKGTKSIHASRELGPPVEMLEARRRETQKNFRPSAKPRLNDEEIQRLRAQMAADGQTHEQHRAQRMRDHRKSVVQECIEEDATHLRSKRPRPSNDEDSSDEDLGPDFLHKTRSEAFGAQATMNLKEALQRGRNRHEVKGSRAADFFED